MISRYIPPRISYDCMMLIKNKRPKKHLMNKTACDRVLNHEVWPIMRGAGKAAEESLGWASRAIAVGWAWGGRDGTFWRKVQPKQRGRFVHSREVELGTRAEKQCSTGMWGRIVLWKFIRGIKAKKKKKSTTMSCIRSSSSSFCQSLSLAEWPWVNHLFWTFTSPLCK